MTEEEFKAQGVITCPECGKMMDATDEQELLSHIVNVHPDVLKRIQTNNFFQCLHDAGIINYTQ